MNNKVLVAIALLAVLGLASATVIWNDFANAFHDDFTTYKEGDYPDPNFWMVDMRDWGLVGKNHYPYLSDNDPTDRRCYENNGVSPANIYFKANAPVVYLPRLNIAPKNKTVMVLRAMGDNTPAGMGYPAGIKKSFKIDAYRDTSSFSGRWLLTPTANQRVGSTIQTTYYFGPGSFEVGMKPLQDFGATTTIWSYHYNEYYPETPDPLQRYNTQSYHDPEFIRNCFINGTDTAENPGANCSCPLNSFPAHPWQQQQMGEFDHWWAANSEIDIEFPTPNEQSLDTGYANMMRFNTWQGQCGVQYTYSFQVIQTLDANGNLVNVSATPGFHDGYFHVWRFDWYNAPTDPTVGPTRVEFYIDGVAQRNVSHNNPTDPEPRLRRTEWEFLQLMPVRPMRLWIGVWFSYWGTASPAQCLTPDDTTDPFSRPCAPWGDASDPENPANPVWREAWIDYVKVTPMQGWGTAVWAPELYETDGLARSEYPYALPYANPSSGVLPLASSTGLNDDFSTAGIDITRWQVSTANWSPRAQTVWGQMCHGNVCKGSLQDIAGTHVIQTQGGYQPANVVLNNANSNLELHLSGDLYNGPNIGRDEIGGSRTDGKKTGAMVRTAQYYGPGLYNIKLALSPQAGVTHTILLKSGTAWEETSAQYAAHCGTANSSLPSSSDCRANCLNPTGWPKGTGFWLENDQIQFDVPYHPATTQNPQDYSPTLGHVYHGIGICQQGTGLGSNSTVIPVATPEYLDLTATNIISGNPYNNADGSRRFLDIAVDWHTWLNDTCPRHLTLSIDGNVIYESACDEGTQGLIPVTAMRVYIAATVDALSGSPYFESSTALVDSVVITQYDEPVDRFVESFPYDDIAEPESLTSVRTTYVPKMPAKLSPVYA